MSNSTLDQVIKYGFEATNNYMDGYYQFSYKQKLYQILWEAQRQLNYCDTFVGEEEWVAENLPKYK
jgi:hypothetical protein